jgi:hypothetical protein
MLNPQWIQSYTILPHISYSNSQNPSNGQVRWNHDSRGFEIYNGHGWTLLGHWSNQDFTHEFEKVMKWAQEKMTQEQKLQEMANSNPAVRIALENVQQAQRQLDVTVALTQTETL